MLVILASRFDAGAAALVRRWRGYEARLLTCEGLSRRGWTWEPSVPEQASLVLDGERVPMQSIRGVASLLQGVDSNELPHIVEEEREYVASEMMAFLVAWLSSLPCPLIGRPTPLCLNGPRLYHEQWLQLATRAGLPVRPSNRCASSFFERTRRGLEAPWTITESAGPARANRTLSIVCGHYVSTVSRQPWPEETISGCSRLAKDVGADLFTANFSDIDGNLFFSGGFPAVDVSHPGIADAMLEAFGVSP